MRKRALLILGLALLIAAAGIAYAHWTDTLVTDADVYTGNINVRWVNVFTNDDGGDTAGEEIGLTPPVWSSHTPASSADPSGPGWPTIAATRYDKDVASCVAVLLTPADGTTMTVQAYNVYPSYYCTIYSRFQNQGTVPVKVQSIVTTATLDGAPFYPTDESAVGTPSEVGSWWTADGTLCGLQIDPASGNDDYEQTVNVFHAGQMAPQAPGGHFAVDQTITFVNWNEWDPAACTHTFNGTPAPLPIDCDDNPDYCN